MADMGDIVEMRDPAEAVPPGAAARKRERAWWQWPALLVIVAIAAVADAWDITTSGIEVYYAAGVRSMAGSWHDFLYASFDPRGVISLDKLPGPFWVQALSVRAFGLSVWAMVLPQVVWSVLTVIVIFVTVRRVAGPRAGLAAAGILALSPVTIASAHGNLGDPLFVLLSVLTADAVVRAVSGRAWWLVLAASWAGLAFQVKMGDAWVVAAVAGIAYLIAGPATAWRKAAFLAAAGSVLAVVSLSWMVFVALTPAQDRPYADGSMNNSVFSQVFDYNGTGRFGSVPAYGLGWPAKPSAASLAYTQKMDAASQPPATTSRPGPARLLTAPVAQVTGWLLVPALVVAVAGVIAAVRTRDREARRKHAPFLVWGLWLLVFTVIYSSSSIVQSYYFAVLSPAVAALCALGAKAAAGRFASRRWRAAFGIGITAAAVSSAAVLLEAGPSWRVIALTAAGTGLIAGITGTLLLTRSDAPVRATGRRPATGATASACLILAAAAALAGPVVADGWVFANRAGPFDAPLAPGGSYARSSQALIAARLDYPGYAGSILPATSPALWQRIRTLGRGAGDEPRNGTWIALYTSAAASLAVLGGYPRVLPVGGFTGSVPDPSLSQFTRMLDSGQISVAQVPGPGDPRYNDPRVQAVIRHCALVGPVEAGTASARTYSCRKSA